MRAIYLIAGIVLGLGVMFNAPRAPWIHSDELVRFIFFRGFSHGMIGFSYMTSWLLIVGGVYQLWLGLIYWDMDTTEVERWQYILQSGGTARLLWILGLVTLVLGIAYAVFTYSNDHYVVPCGIASTLQALLACWLFWLAFPLYEQVGIDRDELHV